MFQMKERSKHDISIEHILSLMRENSGDVVLFVGAGISKRIPSNLPDSNEMKSLFLSHITFKDPFAKTHLNKILKNVEKYPLEMLVQWLRDSIGPSVINGFRVFESSRPNLNHFVLAKMLGQGLIPLIITTNFDELIETAFANTYNDKIPTICSTEEETPELGSISGPTILKLHGTISRLDTLSCALVQVGRPLQKRQRKMLIDVLNQKIVIFIGYGGRDPDIREAISNSSPRELIWLRQSTNGLYPIDNLLSTKGFERTPGDLNRIFDAFSINMNLELRKFGVVENNMRFDPEVPWEWTKQLESFGILYACSQVLTHKGQYTDAIEFLENARRKLEPMTNYPTFIPNFAKIPEWKNVLEMELLISIGQCYAKAYDFHKAIEIIGEGLKIKSSLSQDANKLLFMSGEETKIIGITIGVASDFLSKRKKEGAKAEGFDDFVETVKKHHIPLVRNPRIKGLLKSNIALYYGYAERFPEAIELINDAVDECRSSGDLELLAECLHSAGAIEQMAGNFSVAKNRYIEALDMLTSFTMHPRSILVRRDLAYTHFRMNRPEEGKREALKAIEILKIVKPWDIETQQQLTEILNRTHEA